MTRFVVEPDSPLSAWGQIHRDLRYRIDTGEFAAGARIPAEVQLTEYYEVSRVTIRRSIRALTDDGYLRTRRGSGSYVTDRNSALICDLDLARPWREQLLIDGRDAKSHLIGTTVNAQVPAEILAKFSRQAPPELLAHSRTVHLVDNFAIGVTDSWRSTRWSGADDGQYRNRASEAVVAECFAEVGLTTAIDAKLLNSYLDIPLIIVTARTRFSPSGEIAEYARTAWLSNRVRLAFTRRLTVAEIDIAPLIGAAGVGTAGPGDPKR